MEWKRGRMVRKLKGRKNMPAETQRKKEKDEEKERGAIRSRKREILNRKESETKKKKKKRTRTRAEGRNWRTSEREGGQGTEKANRGAGGCD